MPEIRVVGSIKNIPPAKWNSCFTGEVEQHSYLLAVENSGLPGFTYAYLTAWKEEELLGAVPLFITDYRLDTTLQGFGKKITASLKKTFPKLLTQKLVCMGSPCTESCIIGFHPQVTGNERTAFFSKMITFFESYGAQQGAKLLGIRDLPEPVAAQYMRVLDHHKFSTLPGMPSATLDIDFASVDDYLARLSPATRKDMRRKMKSFAEVRVETRTNIDDVLPELMAIYRDTRSRSNWQFEELTGDYFTGVLAAMPDRSFCTLYYAGNELLAANLLIRDDRILLDKFFCMNGAKGREYNLYFLSWFTNIRYCLEHGLTRYQSGQAHYSDKIRLASKLVRNAMVFKHRSAVAHRLLRLAAPLFSADETLKDAA